MKKYVFRLYHTWDPEDGDKVWSYGNSWEDAESRIRGEYHSILRLERLYVGNE